MPSTFARVSYQIAVTAPGTTVDLVPRIGAASRLVLSRVRIVNTSRKVTRAYLFRIPSASSESLSTALLYGTPLYYGRPLDELGIVLGSNEGLAVAAADIGGGLNVVFTAYGELETIS